MSEDLFEDNGMDGWSYSYPASLNTDNGSTTGNNKKKRAATTGNNDDGTNDSFNEHIEVSGTTSDFNGSTRVSRRIAEISSVTSSKNSSQLYLHPDSGSLLQSPITGMGKSLPADPHTTIEDANSTFSTAEAEEKATPTHSRSGSSQWRNTMEVFKDDLDVETSPRMISFRRHNKRSSSVSANANANVNSNSIAELPKEKFDERLFVDEFFKDTKYRYTTMKRNIDFHQLFRSLDLTDRLLDDYACALSREILLQGRLYISEHNVCFNSNLLGWVTHVAIPMEEIINFQKKSTAGLFPNGIIVETKDTRYNFASFISRDATFEFMTTVWKETTGRSLLVETGSTKTGGRDDDNISNEGKIVNDIGDEESKAFLDTEEDSRLESYILSIDGDEDDDDDDDNDNDNDNDNDSIEDGSSGLNNTRTIKILKFKEGLKYKNMGPDSHGPTHVDAKSFVDNEVVMSEMELNAPLGVVYELLFGDSNTTFITKFIEDHGGSEITSFGKFHPLESDPTKLERTYTYRLELGYTIGPKSTKCEVAEIIEHLNFADYVIVEKVTRTPDVPLGTSFSVRNRLYFSWGKNNTTNLRCTYYIDWTGSSWVKGVIEKQTSSGQRAANEDMMEALALAIKESTYEAQTSTVEFIEEKIEKTSSSTSSMPRHPSKTKRQSNKAVTKRERSPFLQSIIDNFKLRYLVAFIIVLIVTMFQLKLYVMVRETNLIAVTQLSVTAHLVSTLMQERNGHGGHVQSKSDSELWTWVKGKYKRELGTPEKVEFLANQLAELYVDNNNDMYEFKLSDVKDFLNSLL
ncbi:uncharacterized protein KQ657_002827 [Scheffersomyces spartinae]|uniref:VASt domain-containing protein n=1 Tax=Scheffersomyces spartinae TaxID=45513 RepID=A0A9P7V5E0_9ASCO|nr:uncharacterized protein KQ657_002827 [Scheffersomyces spartinae]KAG7191691.1 hypothetical protein KQ657_002827 [Scheffersomyces spartinae]